MPETQGIKADGTPISDETIEAMADEAERGYDVEEILRYSRGGRPPMGSAAASVEEHISVSEAIRRAIGQYLRAS